MTSYLEDRDEFVEFNTKRSKTQKTGAMGCIEGGNLSTLLYGIHSLDESLWMHQNNIWSAGVTSECITNTEDSRASRPDGGHTPNDEGSNLQPKFTEEKEAKKCQSPRTEMFVDDQFTMIVSSK